MRHIQRGHGGGWEKEQPRLARKLREAAWKAVWRLWDVGWWQERETVGICKQHHSWQWCIRRAMSKLSCPEESVRRQSLVITEQLGFGIRQARVHVPAPSLIISVNFSEPQCCLRACAQKSFLFHHLLVVWSRIFWPQFTHLWNGGVHKISLRVVRRIKWDNAHKHHPH